MPDSTSPTGTGMAAQTTVATTLVDTDSGRRKEGIPITTTQEGTLIQTGQGNLMAAMGATVMMAKIIGGHHTSYFMG